MLTALLLLADPLPFDRMTVSAALKLDGETVTVRFTVGSPPYTWKGLTVARPASLPDRVERGVVLRGERYDIGAGDVLTVTGVLRVTRHPAARVNGRVVPAWTDTRVTETPAGRTGAGQRRLGPGVEVATTPIARKRVLVGVSPSGGGDDDH